MKCKKCGNEIQEGEKYCGKCGTNTDEIGKDETKNIKYNKSNNIKKIIAFVIILIIGIGGYYFFINNSNEISNNNSKNTKFKTTQDLESFSQSVSVFSKEPVNMNGLDMIFAKALEIKTASIKTDTGTEYDDISRSVEVSQIKGFAINDDIIGGYIVYYKKRNYGPVDINPQMKTPSGYYKNNCELAVKVNNWSELNNLRNIKI